MRLNGRRAGVQRRGTQGVLRSEGRRGTGGEAKAPVRQTAVSRLPGCSLLGRPAHRQASETPMRRPPSRPHRGSARSPHHRFATAAAFALQAMTAATMAAMKKLGSTLPVAVMVAAQKVEDAMELAAHAESVGASAVSSVVPPEAPGNVDAAVEYWTKIAGASKLPFYIYWIAATADQDTAPEAVRIVARPWAQGACSPTSHQRATVPPLRFGPTASSRVCAAWTGSLQGLWAVYRQCPLAACLYHHRKCSPCRDSLRPFPVYQAYAGCSQLCRLQVY